MPIVFGTGNKLGDYNGYFTNSLNQEGTGASGSTMANKFLQDMKAGRDCLDIVIVGDSNAGYNDAGWHYGWEKALVDNGALPYATCLIPCMHTTATNVKAGAGIGVSYVTEQVGGFFTAGSASGVPHSIVGSYWDNGGGTLRTWSAALDWNYIASGTDQQASNYTQVSSSSPLDPAAALKYRVGYVKFPSGSGQFFLNCYTPSPSAVVTSTGFSTSGGTYDLNIATLSVAANPARNINTRFTKYSAFYGAQYGVDGPVGFVFESIYRERKGFAVNVLHYHGGTKTSDISSAISSGLAGVKTYLNELRQRQIAAGGTGRVLVFANSGINDANAAQLGAYATNANSLIGSLTKAWAELGFPQSDLAFVISVTHPTQSDDANLTSGRRLGKSSVAFGPGGQVTFVDLNQMASYTYLNGAGFYDGGGTSHLTAAGYAAVGNIMVPALLK